MERTTLETAAANYSYLRGLFFLPLGIVFILAALANWEVGPLRHLWAFPVAVLAVGLLCLPIARYYNGNYGRLRPSTRQQVRGAVLPLDLDHPLEALQPLPGLDGIGVGRPVHASPLPLGAIAPGRARC